MLLSTPIHLSIVSDNTDWEERIRSVSSPHAEMLSLHTIRLSDIGRTDVLLYAAPDRPEGPLDLPGCLEYVLCATPEALSTGLSQDSPWTSYWPQPLTDPMLAFFVQQLIRSVQSKQELATTKTFLNTLIDSIPDLIWFKDLRGSHIKVNEAFCRAVGKTKAQCEGRGHYYIWDLPPDEYAKGEYVCLETEEEVIAKKQTCLFDEKVKSKNGLRQFKTYKSPLMDAWGEMFGTVGIAKDVTDLQNIGRELDVIFSSIPFAAMIVDEYDSIISVNQKFCDYFHVNTDDILHMRYTDLCHNILHTTPEQLEQKGMTELRYQAHGADSIFHAQQLSIHDIFDNHFGVFFLCLDVTNEHKLQNRLIHSANTDFLTGLCNRRYFYETLGQQTDVELASVIYFDLDNFKTVNDTYGHQSGDNALILMAEQLKTNFADHLIARLGGDEFVVAVFGPCVPAALAHAVETFIQAAAVVFQATPHMEALTLSAGIVCNASMHDVDGLLSCADKALYESKALGKARYTVYQEPPNTPCNPQ